MTDYQQIKKNIEDFYHTNNFSHYYRSRNQGGINYDYILTLNYDEDNKRAYIREETIEQCFSDEYTYIENMFQEPISLEFDDVKKDYDYILTSKLLSEAKNFMEESIIGGYFNYCVDLDGRYLPKIDLDLPNIFDSFIDLIKSNKTLLEKNIIKKISYQNLTFFYFKKEKTSYVFLDSTRRKDFEMYYHYNYELIIDFYSYVIFWIKAYNIRKTLNKAGAKDEVISYSHRFTGWSQPSFSFKDLKIHFKTNFGYGNSSYFYVLLEYKTIQIVTYTDWIDYPYYEASEVLQYTHKVHKTSGYRYKNISINNQLWQDAMNYICDAINLYLTDEKAFIEEYIINRLDAMIEGLAQMLEPDSNDNYLENLKEKNQYQHIKINTKQLFNIVGNTEDLYFKSSKICGALGFIGKLIEDCNCIDLSQYIKQLEDCNLKIMSELKQSVADNNDSIDLLNYNLFNVNKQIHYVYINENNSIYLQRENNNYTRKIKEYTYITRILEDRKYLLKSKSEIISDLKNIKTLQANIKKYITIVENYFLEKSNQIKSN